jgi:small-conductance mechanosensitive channel
MNNCTGTSEESSVTKGMPISIVTHVPMMGDVREDPIATTTIRSTFMNTNADNIQRLCKHNEEKEAMIIEIEEKLQQVRIDERSLQSFKVSVEKVKSELEESIIDMYANLHLFQNIAAIIIEQNNQIQTKLTQYKTIREGINDIDKWISENPDTPQELHRP